MAAKLRQLNELAQGRQQTLAQMSLAWLLKDQVVTSVILGTSKIEHLVDNIKAAEHLDFTQDELDQIQKIIKG
ncbi:putative ion-channel protein [Agrilactobacillus composti DSM 18527 = JCM 14202]|nr:putative ion-channel protein [Agrilactobacillus composti DSM 18527 = JCM 14202]